MNTPYRITSKQYPARSTAPRAVLVIAVAFMGAFTLLFISDSAHAADASAAAVLKALSEAQSAGLCTSNTQQSGSDCTKIVTTCSASKWQQYISTHYRNSGGSINLTTAGSGGTALGRPLRDSEITPALSTMAQQLLRDHRTEPYGSTYSFTLNGTSYAALLAEHPTPAPPHPGIALYLAAGSGSGASGDALDYLRADWTQNSATPPGPVQQGTCYCACQEGSTISACQGKPNGFAVRAADQPLTRDQCAATCAPNAVADKCAGTLAPLASAATPVSSLLSDATCFTSAECADQGGTFEADADCKAGGRCIALEPVVKLNTPIGDVTEIQGIAQYIATVYRYLISIVAVVATIMFTYGAFYYLLGTAMPSLKRGRQIMMDAIIGLLLVLASSLILRTINPATMQLNAVKAYLVNTRQFVHTALCKDLPAQTKLADAGIRPTLRPYEQIPADAFTFSPARTACGSTYYVQGSTASSCDGSACPKSGEACVSCADSLAPGCSGKASDARVCDRVQFAGTIDFLDGKYPTGVDLLGVCNWAQNTDPYVVLSNIKVVKGSVKPQRVGRTAGPAQVTDEDETGRAGYRFAFVPADITNAEAACASGGGLRGFVLGLVYKESGVVLNSSYGTATDDVAVLSRTNCGNGRFDGYADGTASDTNDEARAIACGVAQGKFQASVGTFWTKEDMMAAAGGTTSVTCDFTLSESNAPEDPSAKMCPAAL